MKTWIFANQALATVIGIILLSLLVWLVVMLIKKFSSPKTTRTVGETPASDTIIISPAPRPSAVVRTSSIGYGHSMAGGGARVGGGSKGGF